MHKKSGYVSYFCLPNFLTNDDILNERSFVANHKTEFHLHLYLLVSALTKHFKALQFCENIL